jgi:hypothetical protein
VSAPNISTCPNECGLLDAPAAHPPDTTLLRCCPHCSFHVIVLEMIVRSSELLPGDYLPATRQTILHAQRGARTPTGKTEIAFRRDTGREGVTHWGSSTRIKIVRAAKTSAG